MENCVAGLKRLNPCPILRHLTYLNSGYNNDSSTTESNLEKHVDLRLKKSPLIDYFTDVLNDARVMTNRADNFVDSKEVDYNITDELYKLNNSFDRNIGDSRYHIPKNYSNLFTDKNLNMNNNYKSTFDLGFTNLHQFTLNINNGYSNNYLDTYKHPNVEMKKFDPGLNQNQYLLLKKLLKNSDYPAGNFGNNVPMTKRFEDMKISSISPDRKILNNNMITISDYAYTNRNYNNYGELSSALEAIGKTDYIQYYDIHREAVTQASSNISDADNQITLFLQGLNNDLIWKNTTNINQTPLFTVASKYSEPVVTFQNVLRTTGLIFPSQHVVTKLQNTSNDINNFVERNFTNDNVNSAIINKEMKFLMKYDIDGLKKYSDRGMKGKKFYTTTQGVSSNSSEVYLSKNPKIPFKSNNQLTSPTFQPINLYPKSTTYIPNYYGIVENTRSITTTQKSCANNTNRVVEFNQPSLSGKLIPVTRSMIGLKKPNLDSSSIRKSNTTEKIMEGDDRRRVYHSYNEVEKPENVTSRLIFSEFKKAFQVGKQLMAQNLPKKVELINPRLINYESNGHGNLEYLKRNSNEDNTYLHTRPLNLPSFQSLTNVFNYPHPIMYKEVYSNETESKNHYYTYGYEPKRGYYKDVIENLAGTIDFNHIEAIDNKIPILINDNERELRGTVSNVTEYHFNIEIPAHDNSSNKVDLERIFTTDSYKMQYEVDLKDIVQNVSFDSSVGADNNKLNQLNLMNSSDIDAGTRFIKKILYHAKYKRDYQTSTVIYFTMPMTTSNSSAEIRRDFHVYRNDEDEFRETHSKLFKYDNDDEDKENVSMKHSTTHRNVDRETLHGSSNLNLPKMNFEQFITNTSKQNDTIKSAILNSTIRVDLIDNIHKNKTVNSKIKIPFYSSNTRSNLEENKQTDSTISTHSNKPIVLSEGVMHNKYFTEGSTISIFNTSKPYKHLNNVDINVNNASGMFPHYKSELLNNTPNYYSYIPAVNPKVNTFKGNFDLVQPSTQNFITGFPFTVKISDNNEPGNGNKFNLYDYSQMQPATESSNQFPIFNVVSDQKKTTSIFKHASDFFVNLAKSLTPVTLETYYRTKYNNSKSLNNPAPGNGNVLTKNPNTGITPSINFNNTFSPTYKINVEENNSKPDLLDKYVNNINNSLKQITVLFHNYQNINQQPVTVNHKDHSFLSNKSALSDNKTHESPNYQFNIFPSLNNNQKPRNQISEVNLVSDIESSKYLLANQSIIKPLNLISGTEGINNPFQPSNVTRRFFVKVPLVAQLPFLEIHDNNGKNDKT